MRATERPALSIAEGSVAIRHTVALRGGVPSTVLGAGCAISEIPRGVYTERSECARNDLSGQIASVPFAEFILSEAEGLWALAHSLPRDDTRLSAFALVP